MSDTFAEQLRSVAESYDASYPPSILGGGGSTPPPFPTTPVTPVINSIHPDDGPVGTVITVVADPSGLFLENTQIFFGGAVEPSAVIVNSSTARVTVPAGATTGVKQVQANTPGATPTYSNTHPFTVTAAAPPPPAITSLDDSAFPTYAILGSGFIDGNTLEITFPDSGKTGVPATWESESRMTFELWTSQLGTHQVQVVATDGSGNLSNLYSFEVDTLHEVPPPPVLTTLAPSTLVAGQGTGVDITVTGTGFTPESQIAMTSDGMSGYSGSVYVSATEMTLTGVMTTYDVAGGGMSLAVSNPPDWTASNSLPITLTAAAAADPTQAEAPKPRRRGNGTAS